MNTRKKVIVVALLVSAATVLGYFHRFWFPGITLKQSVELWLNETEFASPAYVKVRSNCSGSFGMLVKEKKHVFTDFQMQRKLGTLIEDCDLSSSLAWARIVGADSREPLVWQAAALEVISKHDSKSISTAQENFLVGILQRSDYGLVKNRFSTNDYLSEMSARALGHISSERGCAALESAAREHSPAYFRETVEQSLLFCKSATVIH